MPIEPANTDPVLDPSYASLQAQRHFSTQLDAARDIASYWSHLLKRCLSTAQSTEGTVADLVLIAGFFRNGLKAYDGAILALAAGAVGAAQFAIRVLWEAELYAKWIVENGKDRWARQSYVSDLRFERELTLSAIRGTPQNIRYLADWNETFGRSPTAVTPDVVEVARERIEQINGLLATESYREISGWFDRYRERLGREPDWYKPGPNAPRSVRDIAKRLSRAAEYSHLYSMLSHYTHSSRPRTGFKVTQRNRVLVEPVRSLSDFPDVFQFATFLAVRVLITFVQLYRPGEAGGFRATYKQWKPLLAVPEVSEQPEFVPI